MIEQCIERLERVKEMPPQQHQCRLYHDTAFASGEEIVQLKILGLEDELRNGDQYLRPLCLDTNPDGVSVGCAHKKQPRTDIITVLQVLSEREHVAERCLALIEEVEGIDRRINDGEVTSLEYKMRHYRDVHTEEGSQKREEIGDSHSMLVQRLLEINEEVLHMYHQTCTH